MEKLINKLAVFLRKAFYCTSDLIITGTMHYR